MDGLGRIPVDIRLDLARSKERDNLAKQTRSWSGDYDYGKSDMVQADTGNPDKVTEVVNRYTGSYDNRKKYFESIKHLVK